MATYKGSHVDLKKGDEVEITVRGTVNNPCTSYGYVELRTDRGMWNFSPAWDTKVTRRAAPSWWPPQQGDVVLVDNDGVDLTLVRREDTWEVVCGRIRTHWKDSDVLDASPRLIARNRKAQV